MECFIQIESTFLRKLFLVMRLPANHNVFERMSAVCATLLCVVFILGVSVVSVTAQAVSNDEPPPLPEPAGS